MNRKDHKNLAALVAALALSIPTALPAGIVDQSAAGFTVKSAVTVRVAPRDAYRALVQGIAKWWHPGHTFSGSAANLSLDDRPGGCFLEKLPGGGHVRHMAVVFAAPGRTLRLSGGLGPLQGVAASGALTWTFAPADTGTKIEMEYVVGGYAPGGIQAFAAPVDRVLGEQLARLKAFIEESSR